MNQQDHNPESARLHQLLDRYPIEAELPLAHPGSLRTIKKQLAGDLKPVRPLFPPLVFAIGFCLIFGALMFGSICFHRSYGWYVLLPMQRVTVFVTLAATAGLLAFSLVRQMVPGSGMHAPGLRLAGLLVLVCLVFAAMFQGRTEPGFLRAGETCLKTGIPFALPAAILFWLLLRRGASVSPGSTAATAGALAGLVSTGVLELHCPNTNLWHILTWHVGIAFLGALAGLLVAALGRYLRSLRS